SAYTSTEPSDVQLTLQIRIAALVCSTLSITASFVTFHWFCRMQKRFRHRLIMLLIYGDLMRASWFFIAAVVMLVHGSVRTASSFCQSSGFFIHYGTETISSELLGYAVLVIAVHSALQIFNPSTHTTSNGLYPYRRYVYAGAVLIPGMMAGLAFVNPRWGYRSQGAFCSLPIRPFWYRLALTWIPRYLIVLIIIGLTIAIYTYVGFEFRRYSTTSQSINDYSTGAATGTDASQAARGGSVNVFDAPIPQMTEDKDRTLHSRRASLIAHEVLSPPRRNSSVSFLSTGPIPETISTLPQTTSASSTTLTTHSLPGSTACLPLKRQDQTRPALLAIPSGSTISPSNLDILSSQDPTSSVAVTTTTPPPAPPCQMARKRAHIHRQLRLMFIYPLIYTLMWLLPFMQHCTMYTNYSAWHPVWFLCLSSTLCVTSMGFVDCLIFSWREKPWRAILGGDGTFWGSFSVWRGVPWGWGSGLMGRSGSIAGRDEEVKKMGRVGTSTGSNDWVRVAAERAKGRLQLKREERLRVLGEGDSELGRADERGSGYDGDAEEECRQEEDKVGKGKEKAVE
ncbi:hypothetical protein BDW02DRAFT_473365, partial [Decorospora gaudefroyi]